MYMVLSPPPLPLRSSFLLPLSCPRSYNDLLSQARTWEQNGEHSRAIDIYLQLTTANCPSHDLLQESWEKAVDLALKFTPSRSADIVSLVSDRLANMGRFIQVGRVGAEDRGMG